MSDVVWTRESTGTMRAKGPAQLRIAAHVEVQSTLGASIPNAAWTHLELNTLVGDNEGGLFVPAGNDFAARKDGPVLFLGSVLWADDNTGERRLRLAVDTGSGYAAVAYTEVVAATPPNGFVQQIAATLRLSSGDKVRLEAFQSSGGALSAQAGSRAHLTEFV